MTLDDNIMLLVSPFAAGRHYVVSNTRTSVQIVNHRTKLSTNQIVMKPNQI